MYTIGARRTPSFTRMPSGPGFQPAVLTNGTGLTPDRVDSLVAMGGLRFLSINLSTIDRERYKKERGGDHMTAVLRNIDYAKDKPLAEQMDMVVLGTGNENHKRDFEEITARFAGSRFTVKYFEVMDRAGYLQIGAKPAQPIAKLCGCDNVGSRPFQHPRWRRQGQRRRTPQYQKSAVRVPSRCARGRSHRW